MLQISYSEYDMITRLAVSTILFIVLWADGGTYDVPSYLMCNSEYASVTYKGGFSFFDNYGDTDQFFKYYIRRPPSLT